MMATIDTVLEIDTPEHLAFRTRIAGPGRRVVAWIIDQLVQMTLIIVLMIGLSVFAGLGAEGLSMGLIYFARFVIDWFYFSAFELTTGGRSAGKMALKLRVVRPNGLPITWRESILRNFVRAADITLAPPFFVFVGPVVMGLDSRFRRLGDMVAGTIVVVEETSQITRETIVGADEQLMAELPKVVPLDRSDLEALELFVNREHMSPARRDELAEIISGIYADRLAMPRPKDPTAFLGSIWAHAQLRGRRS